MLRTVIEPVTIEIASRNNNKSVKYLKTCFFTLQLIQSRFSPRRNQIAQIFFSLRLFGQPGQLSQVLSELHPGGPKVRLMFNKVVK